MRNLKSITRVGGTISHFKQELGENIKPRIWNGYKKKKKETTCSGIFSKFVPIMWNFEKYKIAFSKVIQFKNSAKEMLTKNCVSIAIYGLWGAIIPANKTSEIVMLSNCYAKLQQELLLFSLPFSLLLPIQTIVQENRIKLKTGKDWIRQAKSKPFTLVGGELPATGDIEAEYQLPLVRR